MGLGRLIFFLYDDLNPYQEGFCSSRVYLHALDALCRSSSSKKSCLKPKLRFLDDEALGENVKRPKTLFRCHFLHNRPQFQKQS